MTIHLEVNQGTKEWFDARCGAITASMFEEVTKVMSKGKNKGGLSEKAQEYAFKLAIERISGQTLEEPQFDSWQARRGRELEPRARVRYEKETKTMVEETGLAITDDGLFGASVDGLVLDDGSVEIKCFLAPSKLKRIIVDKNIEAETPQMQGGLWITGLKWCDFVLYCPALELIVKDLTIIRVYRDDDYIEKMESRLLEFNGYVEELVKKLKEKS